MYKLATQLAAILAPEECPSFRKLVEGVFFQLKWWLKLLKTSFPRKFRQKVLVTALIFTKRLAEHIPKLPKASTINIVVDTMMWLAITILDGNDTWGIYDYPNLTGEPIAYYLPRESAFLEKMGYNIQVSDAEYQEARNLAFGRK